jgi:conjugal transfer pilus assembly protein TraW
MSRCVLAIGLAVGVIAGAVPSEAQMSGAKDGLSTTQSLSPKEAAEKIRRYAQEQRAQRMSGMPGNTVVPSAPAVIKKREGVFYFVSWSLPDSLLQEYMREAYWLGATVVFRGLHENNMRATIDRTKAIAIALDKEAPHTAIDPIIFRQLGVTTVPTLAVVRDQSALLVSGAAHLDALLTLLVRTDGSVGPLRTWYDGRRRSWQMGGPIDDPRPAMPVLTGIRAVPSDLTLYPILEQDMEEMVKARLKQADWGKVREELQRKVKDRLHEGPNIPLTPAQESRVFTVDITQRYEHDIPNHDGSAVIVKAGTEINPLAHVTLRHRYMVIDGRDSAHIEYAKSKMKQDRSIQVWLSAGDAEAVRKQLQAPVYWLQPDMVSRFQLAHVPSVISQNGPMLKIEEIAL